MFEFHISLESRVRYELSETLFVTSGRVVYADIAAARKLAHSINSRSATLQARTSEIYAMGIIDEVMHQVVRYYSDNLGIEIMLEASNFMGQSIPKDRLEASIRNFCEAFPPRDVYRGHKSVADYLLEDDGGISNRVISIEEMLLLRLENENPAFSGYKELIDDTSLAQQSDYLKIITLLEEYSRSLPYVPPHGLSLMDMLRAPFRASPDSLAGQLKFIRDNWGYLLTGSLAKLLMEIIRSLDLMQEEDKVRGLGPGPNEALRFSQADLSDYVRFSPDLDWMPRLVLMAKSTHVWLHQLSVKYGFNINTLDQIPDAELRMLADWGFTGLWLIGIWQRSPASARIKQIMGNPEALSSAYSIYDYEIADDLGGQAAFENLKSRAWGFGIRMATDMVPNHMGIYSRWVIEHPERFIQLGHPPFPAYQFNGEDLSHDPSVVLQLEDGYWSHSDAAVVFKRYDRNSGETRYIYHGNDGTSMPWNDTAQLNMLLPEVREAVIQETIKVARQFQVIRFDAAMTLAKRHFQRLWYPLPGCGGDIPSRTENSISNDDFQRLFGPEFWRELVDRIAQEVPDTLLLAEAFWLMEGYFVRSLGMHRVYNSAFMNMLKSEENSKYRDVVKNVLRFNPEILRRFVNFMNNPDEEPAAEQFGKGDKYFGVATLMVTMPGLPMFGHGQIEGFYEKYGMEYARAYWDEQPDHDLIERHRREIFPLMKLRHLFSGVENFIFYDLVTEHGTVNEDVFAYSNRCGAERALILYNNRYAEARGWLRTSVGISQGEGGHVVHCSLIEGLALKFMPQIYYSFKEQRSGLEYLRSAGDLTAGGLYVELGAYQVNVLLEFREHYDFDGACAGLAQELAGRGVGDIDSAINSYRLRPVHAKLNELLVGVARGGGVDQECLQGLLDVMCAIGGCQPGLIHAEVVRAFRRLLQFDLQADGLDEDVKRYFAGSMTGRFSLQDTVWRRLLLYSLLQPLSELSPGLDLFDYWYLDQPLAELLHGWEVEDVVAELGLLRALLASGAKDLPESFDELSVHSYLGVNLYDGHWWYDAESFEVLVYWRILIDFLYGTGQFKIGDAGAIIAKSQRSGYKLSEIRELLEC